MRPMLAIAAVLTAGSLAGCGPDTGSGRTACELVTPAEINRVIPAAKLTKTSDHGDKVESSCSVYGSSKVHVLVRVDRDAGDDGFEASRNRARRQSFPEPVRGLGDEAFRYLGGTGDVVEARRGDARVSVSIQFDNPNGPEHARQLVKIALDRL